MEQIDVAIIGGGVTGLASALAIAKRGLSVCVLEKLTMVDRAFIAKREPNIRAVAGIFSPETGIVEAEALVHALRRAAEAEGAIFLPGTKLVGADGDNDGVTLRTEREAILASTV